MMNPSIGDLNTRITVKSPTDGHDTDGTPAPSETDVFGGYVWCNWKYAHGQDVFANLKNELGETATVTMRYSPLVTPRCVVYLYGDTVPWEVIMPDNINNRRKWLEFQVKRKVSG